MDNFLTLDITTLLGAANVIGYRSYYSGGSVYDSRKVAWVDLPRTGLVLIMAFYADEWKPGYKYRQLIDGADVFINNGVGIAGIGLSDADFAAIVHTAMKQDIW